MGGPGGTCPPWDFQMDPSGPGFEVAGSNDPLKVFYFCPIRGWNGQKMWNNNWKFPKINEIFQFFPKSWRKNLWWGGTSPPPPWIHQSRGFAFKAIRATFLHMGLNLCVPPLKCDPKYIYVSNWSTSMILTLFNDRHGVDGWDQEVCKEDGKYWYHYLGRKLRVCHLS